MEVLKCLYMENDPIKLKRFGDGIKLAWKELDNDIDIEIDSAENPDEASKILDANGKKYHLLFVDIYYGPRDEEAWGLQFIKEIKSRKDLNHLGIIVITKGEITKDSKKLDPKNEAFKSGADEYFKKTELINMPATEGNRLKDAMVNLLKKKGYNLVRVEQTKLCFDEDNLPLRALIETIGRDNLKVLVIKLLKNPIDKIKPFFVSPGLSGALVLRVDCHLKEEIGNVKDIRKILIKTSRDLGLLVNEHIKRDETLAFPGGLFVRFYNQSPKEIENKGWYAIGADFQYKTKTFLEWITEKNIDKEKIDSALDKLLGDGGLKEVYRLAILRKDIRPNVAIWEILNKSRQARIQLILKQYESLTKKYDKHCLFDKSLIDTFIGSIRFAGIDKEKVKKGTYFSRCHGDLHCRNILVNQHSTPFLIDPASIDTLPWTSDIAKLSADLIVSAWDRGDESYEWEKMRNWIELSQAFIKNDKLPLNESDKKNMGVYTALEWIRDNLYNIFSQSSVKVTEWEFRLALAVEFMRATYRQDVTAPKRVLSLILAAEALKKAASAFKINK